MEYVLTEKEINTLREKRDIRYSVVEGYKIVPMSTHMRDDFEILPSKYKGFCFCKKAKGKPQDTSFCRYCGREFSRYTRMATKAVVEAGEKLRRENEPKDGYVMFERPLQKAVFSKFFYIKKHPEYEEGLVFYYINPLTKINNKTGEVLSEMKIERAIEIVPNLYSKAYKITKAGIEEMDLFEAFQLNSQTMKGSYVLEFDGANKVIDFMLKNKKIAQYTGFLECFNQVEIEMPRTSFFMLYMYIYAQYPVVELLVKMGYITLIRDILLSISYGCNKATIKSQIEKLNKLINPEAKRGSLALKIPKYISDSLNESDSSLDLYTTWCDIYELSGGMSKENYEKTTNTIEYYACVRNTWIIRSIPDMLKYGYTLEEVMKYMKKQCGENYNEWTYAYNLLKDYNHMCDMMQITPDKFPKNIKTAHDNIMLAFNEKRNEIYNDSIANVAETFKKQVESINKSIPEEYVVVMPKSSTDVVQEGQAMHNCVGSYVSKIATNASVIFFIRKKESPNESFITAEYARGALTQIFYKNNRPVSDSTLRKIGTDFCDMLRKKAI